MPLEYSAATSEREEVPAIRPHPGPLAQERVDISGRAGRQNCVCNDETLRGAGELPRWKSTRVFAAVFFLLGLVGLTGCASRPVGAGSVARPVERLDLILTSLALDLDGRPGVDGFGARVYASVRGSAVGTPVSAGRLEFLMYDGVVRPEALAGATPLQVWSYDAGVLRPFAQLTSIGTGYRFALAWGDKIPRRERITIIARHTGLDGRVVNSAPGSIPLSVK